MKRYYVWQERLHHLEMLQSVRGAITESQALLEVDRRINAVRDDLGASDVPDLVVRDRRLLAEHGLCLVVLAVDRQSGAVVRGPDLFGKGA